MKTEKWLRARDGGPQAPIPHSGGEGQQLAGYDASDRPTNTKTGATMTARILQRDPSRLKEKAGIPVSTDAMPPRLPHSGGKVASNKLRPNQKPPRKDGL